MPDRPAVNYPCEDDARAALIAAELAPLGARLEPAGFACLSLRWRRSGADGFLITPGSSAGRVATPGGGATPDDVAWISLQDGADPANVGSRRPPVEWGVHRDLYRQRADVGAIVQARAVFCTTLACIARVRHQGIPAFHPDVALGGGNSIRCAAPAAADSQTFSDHVVAAMKDRAACLVAGHGLLATGATLEAAAQLSAAIETLARIYWQVLQIGEPVLPSSQACGPVP